ncbi:MAG TPA: amidohydrolase family protein [Candidatus Binatia bacterium]|jgi:predicted TIM-barrel fold metal-dependent hydrolase|nr:amidohydrolase family protein [Candidatus Binatia bacterium]
MGVWLSPRQRAQTAMADTVAGGLPVPTQVVSNGEYVPLPQTPDQRRVERLVVAMADRFGRTRGLDRRRFLRTASGMAAAFLAMNQVFGRCFDVREAEAADGAAAAERRRATANQMIVDVQLHFVRDDFRWDGILALGEYAKRWNPRLRDEGVTMQRFKFENFLKEVYLDSDTQVGLVSAAPSDTPDNWLLDNDQLARARAIVNDLAGSRRLLCHAVITPGQRGWLEEIDRCAATLRPDGWKGYTTGDPLAPSQWPWRLDDEKLMYPAYERMRRAGIRRICVHKGLLPADYESTFARTWPFARVDDVGKAAKDWPDLDFVIYHSALKPFLQPPDASLAEFERTGRMDWVTDLAEIPAKFGVRNVWAELGTSFASSVVTHPRHAAALLGTLIKGCGTDRVLWGTDSVWYGSPQWQIEAFRRLEIPADMQERHGFAPLGPVDGPVRSAILGGNAVALYGLPATNPLDQLSQVRADYDDAGTAPSRLAYGFVARHG